MLCPFCIWSYAYFFKKKEKKKEKKKGKKRGGTRSAVGERRPKKKTERQSADAV